MLKKSETATAKHRKVDTLKRIQPNKSLLENISKNSCKVDYGTNTKLDATIVKDKYQQ